MIKFPKLFFTGLLFLVSLITIESCKKDFDNPPGFQEPDITANTSIKALKALHTVGKFEQITDDKIIEGVVIADDKSGNFFLEIVIQDTTGGITIRLDGTDLYTSYPIGRKVYIKCKGLYLNDYNGLIQLGGGVDNSDPTRPSLTTIASALIDSFVVKGSIGNVVTPKVVTLNQLTTDLQDPYQSTLIQLDGFEFEDSFLDSTYADPENKSSISAVNQTLKNCSGSSVLLRNSSYANFAGIQVPQGNGSIIAVYSVFRNDKQLFIRDTSDVKFTGDRCTGGGGGTGDLISIADLRALYTGSDIALDNYKITGVVISDAANKNISGGAVILQDGNSGISIYLGGTITYNIGDSLVFDITNEDSLINYRGSLEIKTRKGYTKPTPVATGKVITPQVKTINDLNSALALDLGNPGNIEFTLVKIVGATAPTGTYAGNKTITDATGNITLYTSNSATFSGDNLPTGSSDFIGYASTFGSTKQFQIRNTDDVSGGGTIPTGTVLLDEDFESTTANADIALTGWKNIGETGEVLYQAKSFNSNKFAQISAFSSTQTTVKSWLITPALDLDAATGEVLTFKTLDGYNNGATLKVYYSTNYDGGNSPSTATWTELSATIASGTASGYADDFTSSGNVSLASITGANVYIAFVYEGGDPGKTTTYQLDDVKVVAD